MKSYFFTGTDTDVGKTVITAGFARAFSNRGFDIGVMKPFAAGKIHNSKFQSEDAELLAKAAKVRDPEELINPQFFPIPASPYTASLNLNVNVNLELIHSKFKELMKMHDYLLVEGMGGIMTPILQNYYVADLIRDFNLSTIIVTRTKIGTINHSIMTIDKCKNYGLDIKGIIINNFDYDGYPTSELKRDLESLTDVSVLGIIPKFDTLDIESVSKYVSDNFDLSKF
ncbi:MAG: dethiobiotin synthase [Crenarchaeota archaeon]|nr:MAG: dethiobiotin synthase [Thermoproteota archaeon]RDJ34133.1 MAG: dethiobiotin synthase [Thermoproteota archaeon]RDJ36751.1 MAG: dethiobiotin synthase [Thermoproteota archaeon]RDJ37715.1 MAG: dethiobiotin synthase [Thermoproteota archaeon]